VWTSTILINQPKQLIEEDIQKDFDDALDGIKRLPVGAKMGVKVAYLYYQKLFDKIKGLPPEIITQERIRIPNARKFSLLIGTYFGMKLGGLRLKQLVNYHKFIAFDEPKSVHRSAFRFLFWSGLCH
jgi:hypothetical protein